VLCCVLPAIELSKKQKHLSNWEDIEQSNGAGRRGKSNKGNLERSTESRLCWTSRMNGLLAWKSRQGTSTTRDILMDQLPTAGSRKPSASSGQIALVIGLEIVVRLASGSTTSFFSYRGRACFRSRSPLLGLSLDLCLSNDNRHSSVLSLVPNEVYRSPFVQTWAAPCPCSTNSRTKTPESSRLHPVYIFWEMIGYRASLQYPTG